jgi:hypothetical protein
MPQMLTFGNPLRNSRFSIPSFANLFVSAGFPAQMRRLAKKSEAKSTAKTQSCRQRKLPRPIRWGATVFTFGVQS